jgi:ABC-type uncharacterized transport system permease subunit
MELVATIPIIAAFVQAIKLAGLPDKYAPIFSVFVGLCLAFIFWLGTDPRTTSSAYDTLISGMVLGLSASGLYSGLRATAKAV